MVALLEVASAAAVVVIAVIAAVIRSTRGGYLGNVLDRYVRQGRRTDKKLDEIAETVDETHEDVQSVQSEAERIETTMYLLHRGDDHVDEEELRQRLEVEEADADLFDDDYDHDYAD